MAGGMDLGQGGNRGPKPLDAAINLVPFIDLMACTIAFLIMTAVWTQLGRLQVTSSGDPSASNQQQSDPDTVAHDTIPASSLAVPPKPTLTVIDPSAGVLT